jgi:hypothetical protein
MKFVNIIPNQKQVQATDVDRARMLQAKKCLLDLITAARTQAPIDTWIKEGGLEVEDLFDAIESGRPHPLLDDWQERKSRNAHRPAPSKRQERARHLVVLLCVTLRHAGFKKSQARQLVVKALEPLAMHHALFDKPPSENTIEHWQRSQRVFTSKDQQAIANAVAQAGNDPGKIADYFIGLIHCALNPLIKVDDAR